MHGLPPQSVPVAVVQPARRSAPIERLDEHQARIRETLARTAAVLAADEPDTFELAQVRWQALRELRELREYQLFKHHVLFDPVIRRGGADTGRVEAMKANCVAMGERVVRHVMGWSSQSIAPQWTAFAGEAKALLQALDLRMRAERAECLRQSL